MPKISMSKSLIVVRPFDYCGRIFTKGESITEEDISGIMPGYLRKGMVKKGSISVPKSRRVVLDPQEETSELTD